VAGTEIDAELAELCHREHPRLVGLLALYVGELAAAEDLAQEAFVRLHQHWPRVRTMESPAGWLSTVAINLARSWWRRRFAHRRAHRRLGSRPEAEVATEPADVLAVRTAVAALPDRQKAVLVLRYYTGLSVAETARHLRCAEGTVKSLTHRAIATLRTQFDVPDDLVGPETSSDEEGAPHAWRLT
jgi:RNA polymerase sigma-70 factor (sigma-E family)